MGFGLGTISQQPKRGPKGYTSCGHLRRPSYREIYSPISTGVPLNLLLRTALHLGTPAARTTTRTSYNASLKQLRESLVANYPHLRRSTIHAAQTEQKTSLKITPTPVTSSSPCYHLADALGLCVPALRE